ncbi:ATP-dependent helicase, partial [Streptomyces sp. TRM76130]|nr:ATP-dependent helicase [Streptomyces sp. TRM76130]
MRLSLRVELTDSAGHGEAESALPSGEPDARARDHGNASDTADATGATATASGTTGASAASAASVMPDAPCVRAVVQLHSLADPLLIADAAEVWSGEAEGFGRSARDRALRSLRRAVPVWPPLERLAAQPAPDELHLSDEEFLSLLEGGAVLALQEAGVAVHLPRDLVRDLTAHAVV